MNRISSFRAALVALVPAVALSLGRPGAGAIADTGGLAYPASPTPGRPPPPRPRRPAETKSPAATPAAAQTPAPPPAAPVQTADPFGEEITLEPKKVVMLKGNANWDSAFDTLIESFKTLTALLDKQGIKASGNPMIVYTSTDDTGFTFLAEIPVDQDAEEPDQGHEHGQIARRQGAEVRPSRFLRQHGQHL